MRGTWEIKKLGDVADVFDGPHATPTTVDSGPIFLGISALQDGEINLRETRHVTEEDFIQWTRRVRPQANDVVFSYETRLGQAAIIPEGLECCLGRRMGLLRFSNGAVFPRYFLYQYISPQFREFLESKTTRGATVDRLSIKDFPSFPILLPPLPEQQRIVALLDEAFAGLATAKANAERNLQSARAIFESHLQSVFSQRGEGWVEKTLDKISTNLDSRRIPITKNVRSSGEYPYYGASGIVDYVADYIFEGDNLLVSEDGANLLARSTPIAFSVTGRYWVNNHAHILHFESMATQRFVEFYLESIKLDEFITGAAQPKLNQRALNAIPIPIPESVEEQGKIVDGAESLQQETQRLTRLYECKLAALEELKKSLLHQAFNGEI
jgi:type I restriction enzyme S subunit